MPSCFPRYELCYDWRNPISPAKPAKASDVCADAAIPNVLGRLLMFLEYDSFE